MLSGLMQTAPLNISGILTFAAKAHGERAVVSRLIDEPEWRSTWAGVEQRAGKLAQSLIALGVAPGDRVTSLAWNTHRHLELFFAVPGMGAVLHTANPRLPDDHIVFTIEDAESSVLFYDINLSAIIERLKPRLPGIRHYVPLSVADVGSQPGYETLLSGQSGGFDWPVLDENTASFLCYTSGTTGNPKGVLYSHRSVVLHAMAAGLSFSDRPSSP